MFTDTMFASTVSHKGDKMAQIYSTSFGWARAHPMRHKDEAHENLSLMFHRDGVSRPWLLTARKSKLWVSFDENFGRLIATLE
jgi:hypothetical protein